MNAPLVAGVVSVLLLPLAVSAQSTFTVASVKPNTTGNSGWSVSYTADSLRATNATLAALIRSAYGVVLDDRLVGGPSWVRTSRFDVNAKAEQALPLEQLRLMAQRLLEDRFGLVLAREQREQDVYELRLARGDGRTGPDLRRAADDCPATAGTSPADQPERPKAKSSTGAMSTYAGWCVTMARLATGLSRSIGVVVVDQTGLPGRWDFVLAFAPITPDASPAVDPADKSLPTIFAAVEEQLGLKLERSTHGSVEYVVIAAAHAPTEN
jgi:uncharacterized protein (TIGR03435 family)